MKKVREAALNGIIVLGVITLAFYLAKEASSNEFIKSIVQRYGYAGIFFISFVDGFNLLVPIPAVSFIPLFLASGLSFWPTIIIASLGMTCADSAAYFLAKAGKNLATDLSLGQRFFSKLDSLKEKYDIEPTLIVFLYACFVPLPNELILVPAAFMGYRAKDLIPAVLAGNLVFNILFAKGLLNIFYKV